MSRSETSLLKLNTVFLIGLKNYIIQLLVFKETNIRIYWCAKVILTDAKRRPVSRFAHQ